MFQGGRQQAALPRVQASGRGWRAASALPGRPLLCVAGQPQQLHNHHERGNPRPLVAPPSHALLPEAGSGDLVAGGGVSRRCPECPRQRRPLQGGVGLAHGGQKGWQLEKPGRRPDGQGGGRSEERKEAGRCYGQVAKFTSISNKKVSTKFSKFNQICTEERGQEHEFNE